MGWIRCAVTSGRILLEAVTICDQHDIPQCPGLDVSLSNLPHHIGVCAADLPQRGLCLCVLMCDRECSNLLEPMMERLPFDLTFPLGWSLYFEPFEGKMIEVRFAHEYHWYSIDP